MAATIVMSPSVMASMSQGEQPAGNGGAPSRRAITDICSCGTRNLVPSGPGGRPLANTANTTL